MGLGRAVASPVLSRAARQVLPLLPQLRSVPEVIGFSVVHALARCFAGEAWCRASAVVLLVAAVAAVGPAQLLAALPAWPVRVCARLAPALVRRKVTSLLLCLLAPTAWREVAVLGRVLPLQAAYLWTALRIRSARLSGDAAEAAWDATHAWATPRIRALLDDFGGFLRKIGQMLGTATPSMPPALLAAFADSMDNAAGLPFWQVKRIIERELRAPIGQIFASLDETPAATASIAQVRARVRARARNATLSVRARVTRLHSEEVRGLRGLRAGEWRAAARHELRRARARCARPFAAVVCALSGRSLYPGVALRCRFTLAPSRLMVLRSQSRSRALAPRARCSRTCARCCAWLSRSTDLAWTEASARARACASPRRCAARCRAAEARARCVAPTCAQRWLRCRCCTARTVARLAS